MVDDPEFTPGWRGDLVDVGMSSLRGQGAQALGVIDRDADRPPFRQIADLISSAIERGGYRDGDRLPPEGEMSAHFSVAKMTVRAAIQQLRIEGRVRSEHGRGVFVCDPAVRLPAGPLNLDDLVALADLIGQVMGRPLSPSQSSKLKSSYNLAQSESGGATLAAIAAAASLNPDR